MAEGIKTDNFLKNWMIDRIYGTVQEDAQGNLNAGPLMGLAGNLLGFDVDSIADQKEIDVGNKDAKATMRQLGETYESLGFDKDQNITGEAVITKAREKKEEDRLKEEERLAGVKATETATAHSNALEVGQQGIDAANARFSTQLKSEEMRYAHTSEQADKRRAHEKSEQALDRRHASERGDKKDSLQMQMAIMQNDLAEKRMDYDRETARMDKRDRMIAQLMSGLGSLGSAFG